MFRFEQLAIDMTASWAVLDPRPHGSALHGAVLIGNHGDLGAEGDRVTDSKWALSKESHRQPKADEGSQRLAVKLSASRSAINAAKCVIYPPLRYTLHALHTNPHTQTSVSGRSCQRNTECASLWSFVASFCGFCGFCVLQNQRGAASSVGGRPGEREKMDSTKLGASNR